MSRREAWLSAAAVFAAGLAVGAWAAGVLNFPRPEDTAYYVGVARNLLDGHGLTSNAIWSYQTPPLTFPRPAFEVWLPLPTFLAAIPMAFLGTSFAAAQVSAVIIGALGPVLAWRLAFDVALERQLSTNRARTVALGAGIPSAVFLPLVMASAQPDSTGPFTALVLAGCLVMNRVTKYAADAHGEAVPLRDLVLLGLILGLAALTRNEAIWLALVWAVVAWRRHPGAWVRLVGVPALVALLVFAPWAIRDWLTFGTPLPGQALANALSLRGADIFAWTDPPTLGRYLDAGVGTLVSLRLTGLVHNLGIVLILFGTPVSAIGLVTLPWTGRGRALAPVLLFSGVTFLATSLLFPVSTTWGTFQHAAGAIQVLLVISAVLALDGVIERVGRIRGWRNPVAWLGPALTVTASVLFTIVLLVPGGGAGRDVEARFAALPAALAAAGSPLSAVGPVITDTPIWFAEQTGHAALALPDEAPASVLDLATHFGATLLIVQADNGGTWPKAVWSGSRQPNADCFTQIPLQSPPAGADPLGNTLAFRIGCPHVIADAPP